MTSSYLIANFFFIICLAIIFLKSTEARGVKSYIVGGNAALPQFSRFLVSIHNADIFLCAGTLVSLQHVATAGECVRQIDNSTVRLVSVRGGTVNRNMGGEVRNVSRITKIRSYNTTNLDLNVAIIKLKSPMPTTAGALPLCSNILNSSNSVRIFGWGRTAIPTSFLADQAREAMFPVLPDSMCTFNNRSITNSSFCVFSNTSKTVCPRDLGGPATTNGQLCGIVSSGSCSNAPIILTRISGRVKTFIMNQLQR